MGNTDLDLKANESESYKVVSHHGNALPEEYRNVIIAPFLNSLRYGNDYFKLIDQDCYYTAYGKYIEGLLRCSAINIAFLDDKTIIGWCLYNVDIVHYVWVKSESRRQGVGRSLLPKDFKYFTHMTNKGINIWVNKFPEKGFNPFA